MATKLSEDIDLNLKEILREKGIMSKDLADHLGITTVAVSKIINNKTKERFAQCSRGNAKSDC